MSFFKTLAGILGGATLGLLFAQKEGKKLRASLKGASGADIAETLGKEFSGSAKELYATLEQLSESDQAKVLSKMGKEKLELALNMAKKELSPLKKVASNAFSSFGK